MNGGRSGFTLLEILIGLALSLMVILAVYAGIRTAVRSITAVERIALENKMLGFGLLAAVERADRWDDLDDPRDTTAQPLRITPTKAYSVPSNAAASGGVADFNHLPYDGYGGDWARIPQPFTRLEDSLSKLRESFGDTFAADPGAGGLLHYDPDEWLPHQPKSWYRGDYAWYGERDFMDQSVFGNYGLFQAAADEVQIIGSETTTTVTLAPWQRWLPDRQLTLSYGLGWYGWLDYLPANALIDFYTTVNHRAYKPGEIRNQVTKTDRLTGEADDALLADAAPDGDPDTQPTWTGQWHGAFAKQRSAQKQSMYRTGAGQAITKGWQTWTLPAGISAREPVFNRMLAGQYGGAAYYSHDHESLSSLPLLLLGLTDDRSLIEDTPGDWPILSVDVRRFINWGSPRTHCYLRFTDPISGESRELFFPLTATTLRGARLSRGLDALP